MSGQEGITTKSDSGRSGSPDEKPAVAMIEGQQNLGALSEDDARFLSNFPPEDHKKVIRKVDLRLIPMLMILYLMTYLDKTNIGNAKIEGLLTSLNMTGDQYNIALSVFFPPYILAEVPSNIIIQKFKRPSTYMGIIIFSWGIIMTLTGVVHNFAGLVVVRFLLGLFEAGFFPGAILMISQWYLPNETQSRIALLYSSAATGGAVSGLLAFAIAKMKGLAGLEGWRWIFIIEGLLTVIVGVACFWLLIDKPSLSSAWLTADEIRYLELRQLARNPTAFKAEDGHIATKKHSHFDKQALVAALTDWKIYLLTLGSWSNAVPNYAMKFTMPTIVRSMGFSSAQAQLMTMPPYIVGAISAFIISALADRRGWRMPFIIGPQLAVAAAFIILFTKAAEIESNVALCYFAVTLANAGMYPVFPGVNAWNVANQAGPAKRAVSIGLLICTGNIGGVVGSYIYKDDEAPRYVTGYGTSLAFVGSGIVAVALLEFLLWTSNERNAKLTEDEVHSKYTDEELELLGDRSPLFKYAL
ncbi:MFS transporter [Pyricularia oryzae]|nr:MFS transporter [Pyricularia oryzae]